MATNDGAIRDFTMGTNDGAIRGLNKDCMQATRLEGSYSGVYFKTIVQRLRLSKTRLEYH